MKSWSLRLGEISGIGVFLHLSFFIVPAWVALSSLAAGASLIAAAVSVVFVLAVFGCVLLHELGHALMARRHGIRTRDITLLPIGGVARLERMPTDPRQELAIALAGPAVNVVIAASLFFGLFLTSGLWNTPSFELVGGSFLTNLLWVNVALVLFNLIPAFPMDGGRVLRALLAMRLPYVSATRIAAKVGQVFAIVFGIVGLFANWMLTLIAVFIYFAAKAEREYAELQSRTGGTWLEPGVEFHGGDNGVKQWSSDPPVVIVRVGNGRTFFSHRS